MARSSTGRGSIRGGRGGRSAGQSARQEVLGPQNPGRISRPQARPAPLQLPQQRRNPPVQQQAGPYGVAAAQQYQHAQAPPYSAPAAPQQHGGWNGPLSGNNVHHQPGPAGQPPQGQGQNVGPAPPRMGGPIGAGPFQHARGGAARRGNHHQYNARGGNHAVNYDGNDDGFDSDSDDDEDQFEALFNNRAFMDRTHQLYHAIRDSRARRQRLSQTPAQRRRARIADRFQAIQLVLDHEAGQPHDPLAAAVAPHGPPAPAPYQGNDNDNVGDNNAVDLNRAAEVLAQLQARIGTLQAVHAQRVQQVLGSVNPNGPAPAQAYQPPVQQAQAPAQPRPAPQGPHPQSAGGNAQSPMGYICPGCGHPHLREPPQGPYQAPPQYVQPAPPQNPQYVQPAPPQNPQNVQPAPPQNAQNPQPAPPRPAQNVQSAPPAQPAPAPAAQVSTGRVTVSLAQLIGDSTPTNAQLIFTRNDGVRTAIDVVLNTHSLPQVGAGPRLGPPIQFANRARVQQHPQTNPNGSGNAGPASRAPMQPPSGQQARRPNLAPTPVTAGASAPPVTATTGPTSGHQRQSSATTAAPTAAAQARPEPPVQSQASPPIDTAVGSSAAGPSNGNTITVVREEARSSEARSEARSEENESSSDSDDIPLAQRRRSSGASRGRGSGRGGRGRGGSKGKERAVENE